MFRVRSTLKICILDLVRIRNEIKSILLKKFPNVAALFAESLHRFSLTLYSVEWGSYGRVVFY